MRKVKLLVLGLLVTGMGLWAQDVSISITNSGDDFVEIFMENSVPVGGFQFILADNPDAITLTGASGGSAQAAGFMLSTNENGMILGFSLTGATIPAGSAVLTTASINGFGEYSMLTLQDFIFSDSSGGGLSVEFAQEGGFYEWGTPPVEDMLHFTVSNGTAEAGTAGTVEVSLENTMEVGGFQFNLVDDPDLVTLVSATTTDRTNGFMLSTNESGMVLGFSLSGAVIADGEGPIAVLTFEAGPNGGVSSLDFTGMIVSDPDGIGLEPTAASGSFEVTGGYVPPPAVTILSPAEGAVISGMEIPVQVSGENMVTGDLYHVYLDGSLLGSYTEDSFTLEGVAYGTHALTVTIADETQTEYDNPEATATVNFENTEQVLEGYTLSLGEATIDAGASGDVAISLMNEDVVGGFQMRIVDFPNYAQVIDFSLTDRTSSFQVSFNEQGDGTVLVVGFDMTLQGIAAGSGPILNLTYESTGIYSSDLELSFSAGESILSDLIGVPIDFIAENGMLHIIGVPPPPLFAPENLVAVGGWEMISLSWTHPEPWNVVGYYIYRDGVMVGESDIANYADSGLESGMTYCYTVVAYDDNTMSEASNEACAETMTEFFEPPQELTAVENGLEIVLDWDLPEGQETIGGPCEGCDSPPCVFDCIMQCVNESTVNSWLGDGFCDDGSWGIYLDCEEYNWDNGDCPEGGIEAPVDYDAKEFYVCHAPFQTRDLLGYEVYRDNVMLDFVNDEHYVDTEGLWYLETYCYNVTAVYDEGSSGFSNTACATPQLGEPSNLSARGEGDYIMLEWDAHIDNAQDGFNIYRDGEFLTFVVETSYEDHETIHDTEYCYTVTAFYETIGESPATEEACSMWQLCPPSELMAEEHDQAALITWGETSCGQEVYLQYADNVLANAFYFYDIYESGFAHGMRFDVGADFDVLAASLYILSDGDEYWPWPNSTHGPVRVMVFDDNNGLPGNLLADEEAVAEDGWATIYPNITGLTGAFHVIASHTESWSGGGDPEGFGIDDGVNYPDNMVTMQDGSWSTGDVLGYGGDYMISALINAYGQVQPMSFGDLPSNPFTQMDEVAMVPNGGTMQNTVEQPEFASVQTRELISYNIIRDGEPLISLAPDVYEYLDENLTNMQEYCYSMTATYTEGDSDELDPVCVTPIPGYAPQNLVTDDLGGIIELNWEEPMPLDNPVLDYQIYRDGEWFGETTALTFQDTDPIAGVEYCYTVTARYISGESYPSNEECEVYILNEPVGVTAVGNNAEHGIDISWLQPGSLAFVTVEILTDNYGGETSWDVVDENGSVVEVVEGGLESNMEYSWTFSVIPGVYTFTIYDAWGDGICCSYGEGYYNLLVDGTLVATGGEFGTSESTTFDTDAVLLTVGQTHYEFDMPYPKGTDLTDAQLDELTQTELELVYENPDAPEFTNQNHQFETNRILTGYEISRDGSWLAEVEAGVYEYFDGTAEHDVIYCYTLRAMYDDGYSLPSAEACAQWILPPASDLTAVSSEGNILLEWTAAVSTETLEYIVYRDGEVYDSVSAAETSYLDEAAIHDVLYCYTVTALYDLGESAPTNEACTMWMLLPPAGVTATAGDAQILVEWMEPSPFGACGDYNISSLPYSDVNSNIGMPNNWDVQGSDGADVSYGLYLAVPTTINVTLCFESTDFDTKLEVFTADDDCVGTTTGYYNDDSACDYGGLISAIDGAFLEAGQYYIVVDGFSGSEGNYEISVENAGAMMAVEPIDPAEAMALESGKSGELWTVSDWNYPAPSDQNSSFSNRPLIGYNIYRDGEYLDNVAAGVFEYLDTGLTNLQEYCYAVTGVYDEGESPESETVCAIPIPGDPPYGLSAVPGADYIELSWMGADNAADFNIYRDDVLYATTTEHTWIDNDAEVSVEYCYYVTANYPSGESQPTNVDCAEWLLGMSFAWIENEGYETLEVQWTEPGLGGPCGDEVVPALPFTAMGTNAGMGDEWPVQGGQGEDYAYSIYMPAAGAITASVCSANTDFDTKMEIFTADMDCVPTTTGYYNDDDWECEFGGLQSTLADVWLDAGNYYVVVDGYSGATGNFEITITASDWQPGDCAAEAPYDSDDPCYIYTITIDPYCCDTAWDDICESEYQDCVNGGGDEAPVSLEDRLARYIPEYAAYESQKSGEYISIEDWNIALNDNVRTRELLGFVLERDGEMITDMLAPDVLSYVDEGLENGTEYCYVVTPVYDEGNADPSNEACGTPTAEGLCTPENFVLTIEDGIPYAMLSWDIAAGCGEDGFTVYRDGQLIATLPIGTTTYEDSDVVFWDEYCWYVKATYGEWESNPTQTECGAVPNPADFSVLTIEGGNVEANSEITLNISLENQFPVTGFQFTLHDIPDLLDVTEMVGTPRIENFQLQFNQQDDGSVIVVGFDMMGGSMDVGEGPILEVTFLAGNVLMPEEVSLVFTDVFLGDPMGNELPQFAIGNTVWVNPAGAIELFMDDMVMNVGQSGAMNVSMMNDAAVAGFQFAMTMDDPSIMHMEEIVQTTERTEGWSITYAFGTVIGFDLTGGVIEPGDGPIITFTCVGDAEGYSPMCFDDIIVSDQVGLQLPAMGHCADMTVMDGQEPGPVLSAEGVVGGIDLSWEYPENAAREAVDLQLMDFDGSHLTVNMNNSSAVAGFQFMLNSDVEGYELLGAAGGSAQAAGFMISTNSSGLVLGFSLTGATIPVGDGPLTIIELAVTGDSGCFTLSDFVFSDSNGGPLTVSGGEPFCLGNTEIYGCTDPEALNYNPEATIDDGSCIYDIYGCTDPLALNYNPEATIDDGSCIYEEDVTWNIYRDGSLLTSVEGPVDEVNTYFDAVDAGMVYCYTVTQTLDGGAETMHSNEVCAEALPDSYTQEVMVMPYMNNMISFNVDADDPAVASIFGDDIFVGWNDSGDYYVPTYEIDQIGSYVVTDGYKVFSAGDQLLTLEVTGSPADAGQTIVWEPFMNNLFAYLPMESMAMLDAFGAYEDDILVLKNDQGEYYVPSLGVQTLTTLEPGKGYQVFLAGNAAVNFSYPDAALARTSEMDAWEDYKIASRSDQYDVVATGISHPIIITAIDGAVNVGDEVVAYAGDQVVGAAKVVDLSGPIVISAWGGFDEYGMELPGYETGEMIDLRLWSAFEGRELRLETSLDNSLYGVAPLTSGSATAYSVDAVPTEYTLSQNYPNPFNPTTSIEFSVPAESVVTVKIFDITGREVATLLNQRVAQGYHTVNWNGTDMHGQAVSAGMYIYALQGEGISMTRKMVLMK